MSAKKRKMKQSWDDNLFDFITNLFLVIVVILVAYPIYFVLVASFTDPVHVNSGSLLWYPKELTLTGYRKVFEDTRVWMGYANTVLYTVGGTSIGTILTVMAGYAFSRKDLPGSKILMKIFVFTMYFGGGMIPYFLVVSNLGLINTRWAMIILGCISTYNIIIVRSFMASNIPNELFEAATIDGCGNGQFFVRMVLPLSKAIVSVMVLYIAVGYWNSYFNAMIFLHDTNKFPLQLYLREILLLASAAITNTQNYVGDPAYIDELMTMGQVVKYCIIVVATVPIMCVYPFIQKYFVKGVMIGSIKG